MRKRGRTVADAAHGLGEGSGRGDDVPSDAPDLLPRALAGAHHGAGVLLLGPARDADGREHDDAAHDGELAELTAAEPAQERRVPEVEVADEVADDVGDVGLAAEPGVGRVLERRWRKVEDEGLREAKSESERAPESAGLSRKRVRWRERVNAPGSPPAER